MSKPSTAAPAPLTVVVRQLSGCDPLVDKLAKPHIDRAESLHADDDFKDALKARVADELVHDGRLSHSGRAALGAGRCAEAGLLGRMELDARR